MLESEVDGLWTTSCGTLRGSPSTVVLSFFLLSLPLSDDDSLRVVDGMMGEEKSWDLCGLISRGNSRGCLFYNAMNIDGQIEK